MDKFRVLTATAAPLMVANIDTDTIIPMVWMRSLTNDPGKGLFARWRRDDKGDERPDFILNREPYRGAKILVAGRNFGCGSSRENAVWALMAFGIRCVVAPSFADIFAENAAKNGLLAVPLSEDETERLAAEVERSQGAGTVTVDLEACRVTTPEGRTVAFTVNPAVRAALLDGLDEIGRTLAQENRIRAFRDADRRTRPWIYTVAE